MKMFVVYDSKASSYGTPFFMRSSPEAIRSFETIANDKSSSIGMYPADFTLFEIGEYCDLSGNVTLHDARRNLGTALELVRAPAVGGVS